MHDDTYSWEADSSSCSADATFKVPYRPEEHDEPPNEEHERFVSDALRQEEEEEEPYDERTVETEEACDEVTLRIKDYSFAEFRPLWPGRPPTGPVWCAHCGWTLSQCMRRGPNPGLADLCNRCGLLYKRYVRANKEHLWSAERISIAALTRQPDPSCMADLWRMRKRRETEQRQRKKPERKPVTKPVLNSRFQTRTESDRERRREVRLLVGVIMKKITWQRPYNLDKANGKK